MATPGSELRGFPGSRHGLLRTEDCRGRFEGDPEKNVLTIADPSLDTYREIGPSAHPAVSHLENVVVFDAR